MSTQSVSFETVQEDVLGHPMTVFRDRHRSLRALLDASLAFGERDYLVEGDRRISFAEHHAAVGPVATWLAQQGVGKGDRVAILGRNSIEWVVTFWATVSLGAIAVGLNAWWSREELDFGIADSEPKLLVDDMSVIRPLVDPDQSPHVGHRRPLSGDWSGVPDVEVAEDDPAVIIYTSGTTGHAKGATHSHRNLVGLVQAQQAVAASRIPPGLTLPPARILSTTPLFHVSGLHSGVVAALSAGSTVIWQPGRFDPDATLATIEREQVTSWTSVPTTVWRVVHHPRVGDYDTSTLRHIGGGGASWSPALREKMREVFGEQLAYGIGYGLTESNGLATSTSYVELLQHPETVGRPAPTVEIKVVDPDGVVCPEGETGEICIRGPLNMLGYWRNEPATRAMIDDERWLHSGDLGAMRDGLLYLTTRRTDLILRGGENVYPVEIENCLEHHPGVAEAAVVGVPDDELGQQVCAVVVPLPGTALDEAELAAHVKERLAYFKVPSRWVVRDEPLPRNASGKVLRAQVLSTLEESS
ncbi:MAG TPA: class I adenylate-forming enzyme family protein [Mycobacteriales bacterium]|nr:class I adenylate-forming enzyme family protein [Mycobacteriales bacterium]